MLAVDSRKKRRPGYPDVCKTAEPISSNNATRALRRMSSSDDDDAPRGLGLGYGVKRGRRDRDEAALGVFGDGDEPPQRRGLGAKKKSSGPVMFVSAGKEEAKPSPAPAPTMSNDDFRAHMAPPPTKTQKPKQPPKSIMQSHFLFIWQI